MGLFQSKNVVGLDIGTTFIKLAELKVGKRGATLVKFDYIPTPPGAIDRGEVVDPQLLSEAIKELHKKAGAKSKNVAVGIWGTSVIVKKISLSGVEEQFLADIIVDEAEQYIPFDMNDINLEYHILEHRPRSMESMELLIIGAQKDHIFKYAEAIELAGLTCSIVDVSGFALANSFQLNYGELPGETIGLLNVGASVTNFVIVDNGDVVFSRDVPSGGLMFTQEIEKSLGVSIDEAESLKLSHSAGQEVPEELDHVVRQAMDQLVDEVSRSLDFYNATAGDAPIQKFFVTGGGALLKGLTTVLTESLGVPTSFMDPFVSVKVDSKNFSQDQMQSITPYVSVPIGLGLRKVGDK